MHGAVGEIDADLKLLARGIEDRELSEEERDATRARYLRQRLAGYSES